jgi:molybdenum-dependent DNA-binding transcriptional regulator ModE
MKMSDKRVWQLIEALNARFRETLFSSVHNAGRGPGGNSL